MREIKFRAWDDVKNRMYFIGEEDDIGFNINSSGFIGFDLKEEYDSPFQKLEHLKYMQFTGLKDSLDKEIYEGDILCDCLNEQSYEVIWDDYGMFLFRPIGVDERNQHPFDYYDLDDVKSHASTIVVGNIYENQELLEGR